MVYPCLKELHPPPLSMRQSISGCCHPASSTTTRTGNSSPNTAWGRLAAPLFPKPSLSKLYSIHSPHKSCQKKERLWGGGLRVGGGGGEGGCKRGGGLVMCFCSRVFKKSTRNMLENPTKIGPVSEKKTLNICLPSFPIYLFNISQ